MRAVLKLYTALIAGVALALVSVDLANSGKWHELPPLGILAVLLLLSALSSNVTFLVHRGWYSGPGAVPHLATAFLLSPGLAALVAGLGAATRAFTVPMPPIKLIFNTAAIALSVGVASAIVSALGGRVLLSGENSWLGPPIALAATAGYFVLSVAAVVGAVSLDQQRPVWQILRGRIGLKTATEFGLGLLGAALAVMLTAAPGWSAALLLPGVLVFLAYMAMDRADRRATHLSLTNAVGRAVAGTLKPELAFQAITGRDVRDALKLDGLALVPLSATPSFSAHVACDPEQVALQAALARQATEVSRGIDARGHGDAFDLEIQAGLSDKGTVAVAVPFGVGSERAVGVLVAWRSSQTAKQAAFKRDELLVLETLADYAAVALETERLVKAEALREVEALRKLDHMKDELLSSVSHELRTPLTSIRAFSELLLNDHDPEIRQEFLSIIHAESERLTRLVSDVLDVAKMESGRMNWQMSLVDVPSLIQDCGRTYAALMKMHELVFEQEIAPDLPPIWGDRDRLQQVISNLLNNAVKFTERGAITLSAVRVGENEIHISVKDSGIGIAPEDQERVFEKFQQVGAVLTEKPKGTGLGLAICRDIVQHHGGRIWVESVPGGGSTFTFSLPVATHALRRPVSAHAAV